MALLESSAPFYAAKCQMTYRSSHCYCLRNVRARPFRWEDHHRDAFTDWHFGSADGVN
jgi:hypothetical protein